MNKMAGGTDGLDTRSVSLVTATYASLGMWSTTATDDAPDWFRRALAVAYTEDNIVVGGANIHFIVWGEAGRRGLVFVHGVPAPMPTGGTHVAATVRRATSESSPSTSPGYGDSDHRPEYPLEQWTDESSPSPMRPASTGRRS